MKVLFLFFTDPPRPFSSSVAALSAVARAAGHEVAALEISGKGSIDDAARTVRDHRAEVIAVSAMSRDWPGAHALLTRIRSQSDSYVVVGGYHATLASHDVAACDAVDAICLGEGERPLRALLERLATERPRESFAGMWVRGQSGWTDPIPSADPEPDIAALEPWDYEVFGDVRAHLVRGINTFGPHVDRFLPTRASRGCPFTCAYCSAPKWGKTAGFTAKSMRNTRPVEHLCDELAALRDRYAPEGFEFWDEHFPLSIEWLRGMARTYPRRVGLPFKVEMHPSAASRERLELLVEAGCVLFHCGVEAGDEELRRNVLHRRTRDSELQRVFDDCRALGLPSSASVMTALPGETRAQARSTVDLLRKLRPGSFMWSTYQALPGTRLGEAAAEEWPAPAIARFDDYPKLESRTPAAVNEAERLETYRELAALQSELVEVASANAPGPSRPRPVDIPVAKRPVPIELALLLGLEPAGSPLSSRPRINSAWWDRGALCLEVESESLSPSRVTIASRDGSRCYQSTARFGLSYAGREAPPGLPRVIDAIAARIEPLDMQDLTRALVQHE